jgi:hypothetical protein
MIPMPIYLMLIGTGVLIGVCATAALFLITDIRRNTRSGAHTSRPNMTFFGYQPLPPTLRDLPPMPECKPARDADFAEVGGISYTHLGMTGEEV